MSTFKGNNVEHLDSNVPNIVLASDGSTTVRNMNATDISTGSASVTNDFSVDGNTTLGSDENDTVSLNAVVSGSYNNSGLIGEVRMYAGSEATAPSGWLYCNGATISRDQADGGTFYGAQYEELFNKLSAGAYWGNTGNEVWGTNTVKLPDFRGAFPIGVGQNQSSVKYSDSTTLDSPGTDFVLSAKGGSEEHILSTGEVDSHVHSLSINGNQASITDISVTDESTGITVSQPAHTHTDSGHSHTTNEFRLTSTQTGTTVYGVADIDLNRTRVGLSISTGYANLSSENPAITVDDPGHNHTVTITQSNHTHTGQTTAIPTGEFNDAHTNMPPYLGINFIIKY